MYVAWGSGNAGRWRFLVKTDKLKIQEENMKISRISFLFLLLFLFVHSGSFAQSAAEKSWKPFWAQFTAAVRSKNKAAVKKLMASESEFSVPGTTGRDDFLAMLDDSNMWKDVQKSVAKGVIAYNKGGRIGRITKDRNLIFQYIGGKWRFVGVMGD
jgi:hypothetical protein